MLVQWGIANTDLGLADREESPCSKPCSQGIKIVDVRGIDAVDEFSSICLAAALIGTWFDP
jgi:hypothetical protein